MELPGGFKPPSVAGSVVKMHLMRLHAEGKTRSPRPWSQSHPPVLSLSRVNYSFKHRTEVRKKLPVFLCHRCDPAIFRPLGLHCFQVSHPVTSHVSRSFQNLRSTTCGILPNDQPEWVVGTSVACTEFADIVCH